jgi:hypothetical protein
MTTSKTRVQRLNGTKNLFVGLLVVKARQSLKVKDYLKRLGNRVETCASK